MTDVWHSRTTDALPHNSFSYSLAARKAAARSLSTVRQAHGDMPPQLRKVPSQSRSRMLVDSVKEACMLALDQRGIEGLSVSAIVEVSGVTFGSIYQYFPNLDGIIAAIYDDTITAALARASEHGEVEAEMSALCDELKSLDERFERDFYARYYSTMLQSLTEAKQDRAN